MSTVNWVFCVVNICFQCMVLYFNVVSLVLAEGCRGGFKLLLVLFFFAWVNNAVKISFYCLLICIRVLFSLSFSCPFVYREP